MLCMCVCIYVCVYLCKYVCYVCVYVSTYVCIYVCVYVCVCMCVCMYVCVYVRMYICMCMCVCMCKMKYLMMVHAPCDITIKCCVERHIFFCLWLEKHNGCIRTNKYLSLVCSSVAFHSFTWKINKIQARLIMPLDSSGEKRWKALKFMFLSMLCHWPLQGNSLISRLTVRPFVQ